MRKISPRRPILRPLLLSASLLVSVTLHAEPTAHIPAKAPRTLVQADRTDAFRAYVTTGPGKVALANLKADFDALYLDYRLPPEPLTYGDPDPKKRDTAKADKWRKLQDQCGELSAVAEAGALLWLATGEQRYLDKAKEILLGITTWDQDGTDWDQGAVTG